ncbi:MAG: hypothetical protein WCA01_10655 [Burkholderiales bacterium]|jgi:hypothetical protein
MSMHDKTLKLVMNLDRVGIEARLAEVRSGAESARLGELAALLSGIEGMPRGQLAERVQQGLKSLRGRPEHGALSALLELVEMNLPNLK